MNNFTTQLDKCQMKRKKIFRASAVAVAAVLLLLFGASWYMLDYALCPGARGHDVERAWHESDEMFPGLLAWRDSLLRVSALRDTVLAAPDGTPLHAYYVRAARPTRRTALLVHGYTDNAVRMMPLGRMYGRDLGYNILLPDLRYAGHSGGTHIQMGWLDRLDVRRWLDAVPALFGDSATVVVHGVSMGAATAMMLAGTDSLPSRLRAFVEDCGYTSVWAQFRKELRGRFGLPPFPLLYTASWLCGVRYGWDFREASALEGVRACTLPMLFIHGGADDYVPTAMVYELYAAKPAPKALWVVPGSAHAMSYHDHPQAYARRVALFLQPYM